MRGRSEPRAHVFEDLGEMLPLGERVGLSLGCGALHD